MILFCKSIGGMDEPRFCESCQEEIKPVGVRIHGDSTADGLDGLKIDFALCLRCVSEGVSFVVQEKVPVAVSRHTYPKIKWKGQLAEPRKEEAE